MKIERTKNAARNMAFGLVEKLMSFIFPFISRTIFIYYLDIEYLGLNSLFTSILSVLSLTELGIGGAMVFHMYRAIAEDDNEMMCALLNFYKKCYRIIGTVMLTVGTAIMPALPMLVKGDVPPDINLYVIYYINLLGMVSTYFLFAYKSSLLSAYQRNDISSKVNSALSMLQSALQIGVIVLFRNYYYYAIISIVINLLRNLILARKVDLMYPQYKATGKLSGDILKDIRTKVSALFVYKVGNVIANSVDTIVISSFLGLNILAIYNNYYYIISMLMGFMQIYYSSMSAGIGNSISVESNEKNYGDYSRLMYMQSWLVGWMSICLICLYQPFMEVWLGEKLMLPFSMVVLLAIYFFYWKIQDIVYIYIEAAGLWQHDRYASLAGALINLALNIFLVNIIGLYGIVISTIVMNILIIMPWRTRSLYKYYFKISSVSFYLTVLKSSIITVIGGIATYNVGNLIDGNKFIVLVVRALICVIVPNIIFWLFYRRDKLYGETKDFLMGKVKNVL